MDRLNYHHLRYFREVAHDGGLSRTADRLGLSQSALSTQIKHLEDRLGHALFDRVGRRLELTEVGRITLDHADRIFETGAELLATLDQSSTALPPLRVGALSTLSRNFQIRFLGPVLSRPDVGLTLRSGSAESLLDALRSLFLDVVLSTEPPHTPDSDSFLAAELARHAVRLHGKPDRFGSDLRQTLEEAVLLPSDPAIRLGFDSLCSRLNVTPRIAADVDDMAMIRLLARSGAGLALVPDVVLQDELSQGHLHTAPFDLGITQTFYAITRRRTFPHPLLTDLLP